MSRRIPALLVAVIALVTATSCAAPPEAPGGEPSRVATSSPASSAGSGGEAPTSREMVAAVGACLLERGWDVVVDGESIRGRNMGDQYDAYIRDTEECGELAAPNQPPPPDLTPQLAREEYDAQKRYRDCLIENGVDAPELPSYQQFEDALLIDGDVYDGSYEAGLPGSSDLRVTCADPLETWGRNG